MASRPPDSAINFMPSSEQARLCNAKQAFSWSSTPGCVRIDSMIATMLPPPTISLRLSCSKAKLARTRHAFSCTGRSSPCLRMAFSVASIPPRATISCLFSMLKPRCSKAQSAFSCTPAASACPNMARTARSMTPSAASRFAFASERKAMLPKAPKACCCTPASSGWSCRTAAKASKPLYSTICRLLVAPRARSSRRAQHFTCTSASCGEPHICCKVASTTEISLCSSGPRKPNTGGKAAPPSSLRQCGQRQDQPHRGHSAREKPFGPSFPNCLDFVALAATPAAMPAPPLVAPALPGAFGLRTRPAQSQKPLPKPLPKLLQASSRGKACLERDPVACGDFQTMSPRALAPPSSSSRIIPRALKASFDGPPVVSKTFS
mmetsp:Transcript_39774/g.84908  ORF Transcript_39774/g.84908 Transcript_39774/m.84908 type:complete len:378 (-) Transcript_39774:306-1439(-)